MSLIADMLEKKIAEYAQKYYEDGSSEISDDEFDRLVNSLRAIKPDSEILKTGWGYDVNRDSTQGNKVKHKYGLVGSLEKFHGLYDMPSRYQNSQNVYVSLKLDGLSVVLYYENGELVDAVTRGDGNTGISIKDKVAKIDESLVNIRRRFTGAIRGEILMSYENFEEYKQRHPEAKNPRNTAAGLINRKDSYEDLNYLDILVYTVVGDEYDPEDFSVSSMYDFLMNNFDQTNIVPFVPIDNIPDSESEFTLCVENLKYSWYNELPADGLVFCFGTAFDASTHSVKYDSIAYKFPTESVETEVVEVLWEMSKTRYAIPRIRIKPVEIMGSTVEFATGHNAEAIRDRGIGPGAIIEITKANEIIPYVESVIEPTEPDLIDTCPDCGELLVWKGVHLVCENSNCDNAIKQDMLCWINTLSPLDNFGDLLRLKYLRSVFETGSISIERVMSGHLYTLRDRYTVGAQDRLFNTMIIRLYEEPVKLETAIAALNIPRFGEVTCRKLAKYPDAVKRIYDVAINHKDIIELLDLNGYIGDANAESIRANIQKFENLKFILDRIVWEETSLDRGKVAITGKLSVKRAQFEEELKAAGYEPTSTVNNDTKFLITDDPNSSSSKNKAADRFGIVKITESEFRNKYL